MDETDYGGDWGLGDVFAQAEGAFGKYLDYGLKKDQLAASQVRRPGTSFFGAATSGGNSNQMMLMVLGAVAVAAVVYVVAKA